MVAAKPCLTAVLLDSALPAMEVGPLDLAPLMRACSDLEWDLDIWGNFRPTATSIDLGGWGVRGGGAGSC